MSFRLLTTLSAVLLLLAGCGKKTAAELADEERAQLREKKRLEAIEVYKQLATELPDDPKAKEAAAKAAALTAAGPKK